MITPIKSGTKPRGWPRTIWAAILEPWRKHHPTTGGFRIDDRQIINLVAMGYLPAEWGTEDRAVIWERGQKVRLDRGIRLYFSDAAGRSFALSNRP